MAHIRIEFEGGETYQTGGPPEHLGVELGYANLEGYQFGENGMIVLDFGNSRFRKIPARRLLRVTEG